MDLELQGKTAIVTGGSRGIGKAIARELAREGVNVAIAARTAGPLEEAARELAAETGQRIIAVPTDTTRWDNVQRLVGTTVSEFGRLDILVNNAAMVGGQVRGTLAEAAEGDLVEDLDTKVVGYFRCMKAAVPHMQEQQWGRVISVCGLSARQSSIYGLRNAAVVHMTKTFSDQLGPDGITLNVVHPGMTRTEATAARLAEAASRQGITPDEAEARAVRGNAIRRMVDAQEIAGVVVFLASPKAECITGEAIAVGGGSPGAVFQ